MQNVNTFFPRSAQNWGSKKCLYYTPFGVELKGRNFKKTGVGVKDYRYGYQGSEVDNEVKGDGNSYTTEFRQLDPRLGRWLSIDLKFRDFPNWSPYCLNIDNPILLSDYNGKEPIKPQAGTVAGFGVFLNNTKSKMGTLVGIEGHNAMMRLGDVEWTKKGPKPATTGPFNMSEDRYIYTEKGGWIDMTHFMFYAGKAYEYKQDRVKNPVAEAVQDGFQQEHGDLITAPFSAFSYEDLPSDKFGAEFGAKHYDPNSKFTLGEQLQYYMSELSPTEPEMAPNYESLPSVEPTEKPTRATFTTEPCFTEENP